VVGRCTKQTHITLTSMLVCAVCDCVVLCPHRFIRRPTGCNVSLTISYEVPEVLAPFANVSLCDMPILPVGWPAGLRCWVERRKQLERYVQTLVYRHDQGGSSFVSMPASLNVLSGGGCRSRCDSCNTAGTRGVIAVGPGCHHKHYCCWMYAPCKPIQPDDAIGTEPILLMLCVGGEGSGWNKKVK